MNDLLIEYLRPGRLPLRLADLGLDFISSMGLPLANAGRPFRIQGEAASSHAGPPHYEYDHSMLPLPDGLATVLQVNGCVVNMSHEYASHLGHPARFGKARIPLHGDDYDVFVLITQERRLYRVRVHARKHESSPQHAESPLAGGRIV
jgi:hypothetical protein